MAKTQISVPETADREWKETPEPPKSQVLQRGQWIPTWEDGNSKNLSQVEPYHSTIRPLPSPTWTVFVLVRVTNVEHQESVRPTRIILTRDVNIIFIQRDIKPLLRDKISLQTMQFCPQQGWLQAHLSVVTEWMPSPTFHFLPQGRFAWQGSNPLSLCEHVLQIIFLLFRSWALMS
jgi:hypothetical protein